MLTRMVDGRREVLTSAEEAEVRAGWAIALAERLANPPIDYDALLQPHRGQTVRQMTPAKVAQIMEIVMHRLGLVDKDGKVN